jgi:pyruvate-formate lyase-activating enzyme
MSKTEHLNLEMALRAIDEAARIPTLELVSFAGGEPFLFQDALHSSIKHAARYGIPSSVVTSAYWAGSRVKATAVLLPLWEAGLRQMSLSYDDAHAAYVRETNIVNAYRAAREIGIGTEIAVAVEPGSRIDGDYLARILEVPREGDSLCSIREHKINSTGRALDESTAEQRASRRESAEIYRGPCRSVFRQISLLSSGKMTPCCGLIPFREGLEIGDAAHDPLDEAVARSLDDLLLKWIAFEGPVEILRQITADTDTPLTGLEFDGICHACDTLFSDKRYLDLAAAALPGKQSSLRLQETIYRAMGLFDAVPAKRVIPDVLPLGTVGST